MHKTVLAEYGLKRIAAVRIEANSFCIDVEDAATTEVEGCIYVFVVNDEIVRVGSSAAPLKKRLAGWRRDVSIALAGGKSSTPIDEAERWRQVLCGNANGAIYARQAHTVAMPVGTFTGHLDEERVMIARHRPSLNRSSR